MKVFYAMAGAGDLVESHARWVKGEHNPTEVSITFSSQIQDFCKSIGADGYLLSTHPKTCRVQDGGFTIEHRPKRARRGMRYHIEEIMYGIGLIRTAVEFQADVALVDSGCTHFFVLALLRMVGIAVIPILHNTLWPAGFPPKKLIPRVIRAMDSVFWRYAPRSAVAVSPECERQLVQLRGSASYPVFQIRAQFSKPYFDSISPPPPHQASPFRVMFVGMIDEIKGVFDILEIARLLEDSDPGLVRWEICGRGKDAEKLQRRHEELRLEGVVNLVGWTSLTDLVAVYNRTHACIVPTRSSFAEGLAMTAAEAILAGRPVITNPVVPALEVLRPACVEARTNDPQSYCNAVRRLATDESLYLQLCRACPPLAAQFYDRRLSLAAALSKAVS